MRFTLSSSRTFTAATVVSSPGVPRYRSLHTPASRQATARALIEGFTLSSKNSMTSGRCQPRFIVMPMPAWITPSLMTTITSPAFKLSAVL